MSYKALAYTVEYTHDTTIDERLQGVDGPRVRAAKITYLQRQMRAEERPSEGRQTVDSSSATLQFDVLEFRSVLPAGLRSLSCNVNELGAGRG